MADTFNYCAVPDPTGAITLRVRKAQFGDGYVQSVADGIHNKVRSWPLTFRGPAATIQAIAAFLDAHTGAVSFLWTPPAPSDTQGYFTCDSYTVQANGASVYTLTATFQEVFHA
jgi:phage-related protein